MIFKKGKNPKDCTFGWSYIEPDIKGIILFLKRIVVFHWSYWHLEVKYFLINALMINVINVVVLNIGPLSMATYKIKILLLSFSRAHR